MSDGSFSLSPAGLAGGYLTRTSNLPQVNKLSPAQLLPKAKEFESILLGQWLQSAETSFGSVPGAEDDRDAGEEQMSSFGVQQLAKSLSDAGGIGIAQTVAKALAHEASTHSRK